MVKADEKMTDFSEIQYQNRKTGEYILALKSTNQNDKPVFFKKIRKSDNSYKYSTGNKDQNWKTFEFETLDKAIEDLEVFIYETEIDKAKEKIMQLEESLKKPEGLKLYNLKDF